MPRVITWVITTLLAISAGVLALVGSARGQDPHVGYRPMQNGFVYPQVHNPDLFYNFYVPGNAGAVHAEMYPAPYPTPPLVGHTYYTYQPLMPAEFMYRHHRSYHRYYNYGRGLTRTKVHWW